VSIDLAPAHVETLTRILAHLVTDCDVLAFGSRVNGNARKYSDLDLAVKGEEPLGFSRYARLRLTLEDSTLPINVDILDWHSIPERFRENIQTSYVLVQEGTGQSEKAFPSS
jgi:type I restriction enzyme S subunit